jgi:hypothetical protein
MNRTELLDSLYSTRRELLRLIVATGQQTIDGEKMKELVSRRDQITWTINAIIDGELLASMAGLDAAVGQIEQSSLALQKLAATEQSIDNAIKIATSVVNAASSVVKSAATIVGA